jgi:citrate synthase
MSDKPLPPFWRERPLSAQEHDLMTLACMAHASSVYRENVSSVTVLNAWVGSRRYEQAIAAGILTLGDGLHAPVVRAMALLGHDHPGTLATGLLKKHQKVPGWGNAFVKDHRDPAWDGVDRALFEHFNKWWTRLEMVTMALHDAGKKLYPNPAAYTAACCMALEIPNKIASYLVVAGRLNAWTELVLRQPAIWHKNGQAQKGA